MRIVSQIVAERGHTESVKSLHVLKLGCIAFSWAARGRGALEAGLSTLVEESLREALSTHPNVFEVSTADDLPPFNLIAPHEGAFLYQGEHRFVKVNIPAAAQKFARDWPGNEPTGPFEILTSGSLYAAYMPVSDFPGFSYAGHEFRELLKAQLEKSRELRSAGIGPSPIHPDIYVVGLDADSKWDVWAHDGAIFAASPARAGLRDVVMRLFLEISHPLLGFYRSILQRQRVIEKTARVYECFETLEGHFLKGQGAWGRFFSPRRSSDASKKISATYTYMFKAEMANLSYLSSRTESLSSVRSNNILGLLPEYFDTHLEDVLSIPESLLPSLAHFGEQSRAISVSRTAVIASIVGALIGAITTVILTSVRQPPQ